MEHRSCVVGLSRAVINESVVVVVMSDDRFLMIGISIVKRDIYRMVKINNIHVDWNFAICRWVDLLRLYSVI